MKNQSCAIFYITLLNIGLRGSELHHNVKATLAQHTSELRELLKEWQQPRLRGLLEARAAQKDWLPGYIIKYDIARVANSQKLKSVIKQHKLNLLDVPRKYVYQVYDKAKAPNNQNSVVIAEEIRGTPGIGSFINLQQIKQLYHAALVGRHYDMHLKNYMVTQSRKIYIIDTDSEAMPSYLKVLRLTLDWILNGSRIYRTGIPMNPPIINDPSEQFELATLSLYNHHHDNEAYEWLRSTLQRREEWRKTIHNYCMGFMVLASLSAGTFIGDRLARFLR
jgi:hypothetical protein